MKIAAEELLSQLSESVNDQLIAIDNLKKMDDFALNWRERTESWSVLECVEHLKRYADFYNKEIQSRITTNSEPATAIFRSGWIGNYFAKSMLPKPKLNKMNTFKEMNPLHSHLNRNVLDVFSDQLKEQLNLLKAAEAVNLTKVKTSISISTALKLRLGDTFRVLIYHQMRHFEQINRVLSAMKVNSVATAS
jgi:hypothetical protein